MKTRYRCGPVSALSLSTFHQRYKSSDAWDELAFVQAFECLDSMQALNAARISVVHLTNPNFQALFA